MALLLFFARIESISQLGFSEWLCGAPPRGLVASGLDGGVGGGRGNTGGSGSSGVGSGVVASDTSE